MVVIQLPEYIVPGLSCHAWLPCSQSRHSALFIASSRPVCMHLLWSKQLNETHGTTTPSSPSHRLSTSQVDGVIWLFPTSRLWSQHATQRHPHTYL